MSIKTISNKSIMINWWHLIKLYGDTLVIIKDEIKTNMKHCNILTLLILFLWTDPIMGQSIKIVENKTGWQLIVKNKPFYIKGVVGDTFLDKVKVYGGNSIRIGWNKEHLDRVSKLGLLALVNLPAGAERDGMDYNDTARVQKQTAKIVEIVKNTKNHPAVLMWSIGNELDFIPPTLPYNLKMWDAVNQAAKAIKAIDPNHPVITVIGTSMMEKIAEIVKRCPDIDLLGINTYGDIYTLPETLKKYGWTKPYLISEWGPDGYWEVHKTKWNAPYEQTGLEKYLCYEKKYREAILANKNQCLGSFVFYWSGKKQETTHTWFNMFNAQSLESPLVGLMQWLWIGKKPGNTIPVIDSMNIGNFRRYEDINLSTGKEYSASSMITDTNGDSITYLWEIRPEATYASYAGQGEKEPQPINGLIKNQKSSIIFIAPYTPGAYRLFVYAFDGKGHFSSANLPFYVKRTITGNYPLPILPDTSSYGKYTSRTHNLLQSSTPQKRNTIKILVYGQSISAQNWWLEVKRHIENQFPNANLIMENKAIDGFASQILCKTVEMDVCSFYPDLVLLHIYGSNQMYDSVLYTIRSRTTAEIAIQTDHFTGFNQWSDTMSYHFLPAMAEKYKCDLINIRDPWKRYLIDQQLDSSQLLSDAVHLNEFGNFLMAELIKPLFTYKSKFTNDPFGLVTSYIVDKDVKIKGNKVILPMLGNKVEVIVENAGMREGKAATILIDGRKPSEFHGTYYISRPYNSKGESWPWKLPAWIQIQHTTPWVNEKWICRFTKTTIPYKNFSFEISGSLAGFEGSGMATEDFVSKSGKVIIKKGDAENGGDWHLNRSYQVLKTIVNNGDEVHWETYSISSDSLSSKALADSTIENSRVLFQGVPNTYHILTINNNNKNLTIKQIKVYRPYFNR